MMKFADKRYYSNPGSRSRNVYKLKFSMKTNAEEVMKTGREDWQAYIESFRDGCDINNIIKRIQNGDVSVLNVRSGFYGDITNAPETLQEALNAKLEIDRMYENLPDDVAKKFGDVDNFIAMAGSEEWFENLGVKVTEEVKEKKEVNDSES